jgi:drug/metabolite transporter (DMT)-like permease
VAVTATPPTSRLAGGVILGLLGILGFSFSFPATKLANAGLDAWLVAFGRAAVAAALAVVYLRLFPGPRPSRPQWARLAIVAAGAVIGFPVLSGLALVTAGSAHGAVVIALLPAATALAAVARAGERPGLAFWAAATAGMAVVVVFSVTQSRGGLAASDLLLLAAVAAAAFGYAEGGALARDLGGARTIAWALVLSAPLTVPVTAVLAATTGLDASASAWAGFAYVAAVSMFLGFVAWYAGLARGGVAKIGQLQLGQPILTLLWSAAVLGEHVGPGTLLAAVLVLACVVATQRAR